MRADVTWRTAVVRGIRHLTPGIREFVLDPAGGAGAYPTGAHLMIRVMIGARQDVRHYSLVGDGPVDGCWRIAVQRAAEGRGGSAYMWGLPEGARLEVSSPASHFELSRGAPSVLLIAGGIGITPMVGMAQGLRRRGTPFRLLYGGRSRAEMAYLEMLTQELGSDLVVFAGDRMDLPAAIAALPPGGEAYVCGPLGLLDAAKHAWAASGRKREGLVFETFGSSGAFAAAPFTVRVPRLGLEVPVPVGTTMLDALEAAGVAVLWDCRRGECGLCAMDVLETEGVIDHRDVFLSEAQREDGRKMCVCVSRMASGVVAVDPAGRGDAGLMLGRTG